MLLLSLALPVIGQENSIREEGQVFRVVLDPRFRTTVSSKVASTVTKITKEMGDTFRKGEVLIRLDDELFRAMEKKARFLLERAKALLSAKEVLYKDNVASAFELKDAQAGVAVAELDFIKAQQDLADCNIRTPYPGHIELVHVHDHELVQVGEPLIEIVNDQTLLAKILVPSSYYNKLETGQVLYVDVKETKQRVPAIITHIGAVIDASSSMMKIFAEINNNEGKLRAGMIGMTRLSQKEGVE
jgi:RND family efflux transporter MFP subunit